MNNTELAGFVENFLLASLIRHGIERDVKVIVSRSFASQVRVPREGTIVIELGTSDAARPFGVVANYLQMRIASLLMKHVLHTKEVKPTPNRSEQRKFEGRHRVTFDGMDEQFNKRSAARRESEDTAFQRQLAKLLKIHKRIVRAEAKAAAERRTAP